MKAHCSWPGARALLLLMAASCGYQSVYASDVQQRWCVRAAPSQTPDFATLQAAVEGVRSELARAGALGPDSTHPCVMVELLRVREAPSGVRALEPEQGRARPFARGSRVEVTARAWLLGSADGRVSRDTGDMTRIAVVAGDPDLLVDSTRHRNAAVTAARSLGEDLGRRVLGLPVPTAEPL